MSSTLQDLPEIGLTFKSSNDVAQALAYAREHCNTMTYNHVARSAYWASIINKKDPSFTSASVDLETVIMSCILHDMGWAETKALLSEDKRFEVDSANIAADFIRNYQIANPQSRNTWSHHRIQRCWDAIALHSTPSIARHAAPEVALTSLAIMADFFGPAFPNGPGGDNLISLEEYRAVVTLFPRNGFTSEGLKQTMCGLCRSKPATTFDNFVGGFGVKFGTDGRGGGREEFVRAWEGNQASDLLLSGLDSLEKLDAQL